MTMNTLLLVLFFVVSMVMFAGLVTWPHWFVQSFCKHRLWALRDEVSSDITAGRLPYTHPAVREFAVSLDFALRDVVRVHIVDVWAWHRATRGKEKLLSEAGKPASTAGLTEAQIKLLEERRENMMFLVMSMILLGSWIGVGFVSAKAFPRVLRALWMAPGNPLSSTEREAAIAVRDATERTISSTHIGQEVREFVGFKVDDRAHALAVA
jgi:hypothetical protein